jgi:hypothetical protein
VTPDFRKMVKNWRVDQGASTSATTWENSLQDQYAEVRRVSPQFSLWFLFTNQDLTKLESRSRHPLAFFRVTSCGFVDRLSAHTRSTN